MSDLMPPPSDSAFVHLFEAIISEDPAAYGREGEIVYQVTRNELLQIEAKLNYPRQALEKLLTYLESLNITYLDTFHVRDFNGAIEEARKGLL